MGELIPIRPEYDPNYEPDPVKALQKSYKAKGEHLTYEQAQQKIDEFLKMLKDTNKRK